MRTDRRKPTIVLGLNRAFKYGMTHWIMPEDAR